MSYPDFIYDREGLKRWREHALEGDGHDMAKANKNTLYRLVQTIDNLESRALAAERSLACLRNAVAGVKFEWSELDASMELADETLLLASHHLKSTMVSEARKLQATDVNNG